MIVLVMILCEYQKSGRFESFSNTSRASKSKVHIETKLPPHAKSPASAAIRWCSAKTSRVCHSKKYSLKGVVALVSYTLILSIIQIAIYLFIAAAIVGGVWNLMRKRNMNGDRG
ncbi:hypothetical protein CBW65_20020 [Tumebacillus avium]|uniref:Uncharacterized protein n=1 Tax=Tumebacillus avium TaxID=1903704 RepID=A0A1Y0IUK0_9BACL|nr:hypothetical protein CBW65_20020 [Tumebacillus avium]